MCAAAGRRPCVTCMYQPAWLPDLLQRQHALGGLILGFEDNAIPAVARTGQVCSCAVANRLAASSDTFCHSRSLSNAAQRLVLRMNGLWGLQKRDIMFLFWAGRRAALVGRPGRSLLLALSMGWPVGRPEALRS